MLFFACVMNLFSVKFLIILSLNFAVFFSGSNLNLCDASISSKSLHLAFHSHNIILFWYILNGLTSTNYVKYNKDWKHAAPWCMVYCLYVLMLLLCLSFIINYNITNGEKASSIAFTMVLCLLFCHWTIFSIERAHHWWCLKNFFKQPNPDVLKTSVQLNFGSAFLVCLSSDNRKEQNI